MRYSDRLATLPYTLSRALDNAPAESFRRDARVIGVVGLAHGVSHSSSSRCRRCFRCCARNSTSRGRCSASIVGVFYVGERHRRSSPRGSRSTASARVRCCSAEWHCSPAARCWRRSRRIRGWLFPCRRDHGRRATACSIPSDFAILNANVDAATAGPRVLDARCRRQPRLRAGADRELRRWARRSAGASRSRRWASCGLVVLGVLATPAAHPHVASRGRCASRTRCSGSVGAVPAAGDPAVLLSISCSRRWPRVGLQTFLPSALNAGLAVPLVARDVGA